MRTDGTSDEVQDSKDLNASCCTTSKVDLMSMGMDPRMPREAVSMVKVGMKSSVFQGTSGSTFSKDTREKIPKVSRTDKNIYPKFTKFKNTRAYHVSKSVKALAAHEKSGDSFDVAPFVALKTRDVCLIPRGLQMMEVSQNSYNTVTKLSSFHTLNQNPRKKKSETMSLGNDGPVQKSDNGPLNPTPDAAKKNQPDENPENSMKKGGRRKRALKTKPGQSAGRWTPEEHQEFLEGLKIFGREWKKVAERIPTRTSAQIRSHAQKYFAKLAREENMMLQDQHAASIGNIPHPANAFITVPEPASNVSISVQRNVNRILANPSNVQHEVEETLRELRERYRQLQIRLEDTIRQQNGLAAQRESCQSNDSMDTRDYHIHCPKDAKEKKLEPETIPVCRKMKQSSQDDTSSVSTVSVVSRSRELGNEELIALSVLGGSLPGGPNPISDKAKIDRSPSPTSTIASHQDTDEAYDKSRKRKFRESDSIS